MYHSINNLYQLELESGRLDFESDLGYREALRCFSVQAVRSAFQFLFRFGVLRLQGGLFLWAAPGHSPEPLGRRLVSPLAPPGRKTSGPGAPLQPPGPGAW